MSENKDLDKEIAEAINPTDVKEAVKDIKTLTPDDVDQQYKDYDTEKAIAKDISENANEDDEVVDIVW